MRPASRKKTREPAGAVIAAAAFKAQALAVMRRVKETGLPVTITSRGKALVRVEPIHEKPVRSGYGAMRGTVELLVPEAELTRSSDSATWETLEEWEDATKP